MESTLLAVVAKLITVVVSLMTMVGALQADVNTLKAGQTSGSPTFGAVTFLTSPVEIDGSQTFIKRLIVRQASSTLAIFKSPAATSTIAYAACNIASGNTYGNTYQIGWSSATQGAITTMIAQNVVAAAKSGSIIATSTGLGASFAGATDGAIPPNTLINAIISTTTTVTLAPVGSCTVEFHTI